MGMSNHSNLVAFVGTFCQKQLNILFQSLDSKDAMVYLYGQIR